MESVVFLVIKEILSLKLKDFSTLVPEVVNELFDSKMLVFSYFYYDYNKNEKAPFFYLNYNKRLIGNYLFTSYSYFHKHYYYHFYPFLYKDPRITLCFNIFETYPYLEYPYINQGKSDCPLDFLNLLPKKLPKIEELKKCVFIFRYFFSLKKKIWNLFYRSLRFKYSGGEIVDLFKFKYSKKSLVKRKLFFDLAFTYNKFDILIFYDENAEYNMSLRKIYYKEFRSRVIDLAIINPQCLTKKLC